MDRGAWWDVVHGGHRESDRTERLSTLNTSEPLSALPTSSSFAASHWSLSVISQQGSLFPLLPYQKVAKFKPDMRGDWLDRRPPPGGRVGKGSQKTPL